MKKKVLFMVIILCFISTIMMPLKVSASSKNIKIDAFIKLLVQSMELEVNKKDKSPYISSAIKYGLLKENDFESYTKYITRTDVAVLVNRADEYLHGNTVDSELVDIMLEKRISDIADVKENKKESVAKIMAKGIIKGYGNGYYVQNRSFKGNDYITVNGAKNVISLALNPKKRASISPDGQLIRTTTLPSNADKYEYVLECFPNSFYEYKFGYQITKYYYKPIELEHYASPKKIKQMKIINPMIKKYGDVWIEKVENNLRLRLNVDYRTVDTSWINELAQTYWYDDASDIKRNVDSVKSYIKKMKKNKVNIESDIIAVEPSTINYNSGVYLRVYVKFKVQADSLKNLDNVFYGDTEFANLKNNTWHYGVYEIGLGTRNGSSDGYDWSVTSDSLNDYRFNVIYKEL